MSMSNFITKWRRDRAVDRIIRNGQRLEKYRAEREALASSFAHTEVDFAYLSGLIDTLERRIERDKDFIRNTA